MSAWKDNTTVINKQMQCVLTLLALTLATARLAISWKDVFVEVNKGMA